MIQEDPTHDEIMSTLIIFQHIQPCCQLSFSASCHPYLFMANGPTCIPREWSHSWFRIGNAWFTTVKTPQTWKVALKTCQSIEPGRSTLASIDSKEEQDAIDNNKDISNVNYWTAGVHISGIQKWYWYKNTTGKVFLQEIKFNNWASGEPSGGGEDLCIHLLHTREWNDFNCLKNTDKRFPLYALCEIRCNLKGNIMNDLNDAIKNEETAKANDVVFNSTEEKNKNTEEVGKSNDTGKSGNDPPKKNGTANDDSVKGGKIVTDKSDIGVRTESPVKNNDIPSTWKILTEKTRRWLALPSTLKVIKKYATVKMKMKNSTQV